MSEDGDMKASSMGSSKMMNASKRQAPVKGGIGASMKASRMGQSKRAGGVASSKAQGASSTGSPKGGQFEVYYQGSNRTPRPLIKTQSSSGGGGGGGEDISRSQSMNKSTSSNNNVDADEEDDLGGMNMNISMSRSMKSSGTGGDGGQDSDHDSANGLNEEDEEMVGEEEMVAQENKNVVKAVETVIETFVELSEQELNETVTITLSETSTKMLLSIPGNRVQNDTKQHAKVTERNKRYESLVSAISSSDLYTKHSAQTFNYPTKNKQIDASPAPMRDETTYASSWDIYDTNFQRTQVKNNAARRASSMTVGEKVVEIKSALSKYIDHEVSITLASPGCLLPIEEETNSNVNHTNNKPKDGATAIQQAEIDRILNDPGLLSNLRSAERLVEQNIFHKAHLLYRDVPDTTANKIKVDESAANIVSSTNLGDSLSSSSLPQPTSDDTNRNLELLWIFECPLTAGRNVSSFAWNKLNPDLLVVGYGDFKFAGKQSDGLLLFWSLKNPNYPERVIRVPHGVTAVDFSTAQPALLAVGLYDGTVAIYNIKLVQDTPVLESAHEGGKHSDAVWQVKWVNKGADRGENIVSISTDGRISEWSMKKGLQVTDLMLLKRVQNSTGCSWKPPQSKGEGIIVRHAAGMAFDFCSDNAGIYYVGTEDGVLHKCSSSYNDNYLENYFGHSGPIYKVRVNPFSNNSILSCSADWTIKLWDTKEAQPKLSFQSIGLSDAVYDIAWSPNDSTVFASVTGDGRVELWDIKTNSLSPFTSYQTPPIETDAKAEEAELAHEHPEEEAKGKKKKKIISDDDANDGETTMLPIVQTSTHNVKMSAVLFAPKAPILIAGDDHGSVKVFRVHGLEANEFTQEEQVRNLYETMNEFVGK